MKRIALVLLIVQLVHGQERDYWSCIEPTCETVEDRRVLWPFPGDPNFYQQCEQVSPVAWSLKRRPCKDKRLFRFDAQLCVPVEEWEVPCPLPWCPIVACETTADLFQLWPHGRSDSFYQCIPRASGGGFEAVVRQCELGYRFSAYNQRCVVEQLWRPECIFQDGITTEPPTDEPEDTTTSVDQTTTTTEDTTTTTTPGTPTPEPERGTCPIPLCRVQDQTLYPHTDWTRFWQCIPNPDGFWVPVVRPCGAGTYFHFGDQRCVFMADWEDFCL
ncbi:uncharacterized protein LOC129740586 [Uranotaenia lowii]|uniref:uncharacterized protein LOC129740586 n=1 Tax=Uranotaenia lowii TaxID=190385 RepID=UPI002478D268|nr:uncharacterized protein LOC129740586 [Uranotaenia lowii]